MAFKLCPNFSTKFFYNENKKSLQAEARTFFAEKINWQDDANLEGLCHPGDMWAIWILPALTSIRKDRRIKLGNFCCPIINFKLESASMAELKLVHSRGQGPRSVVGGNV